VRGTWFGCHPAFPTDAPLDSAIVLTLPIHDGVRLRAIACLEF